MRCKTAVTALVSLLASLPPAVTGAEGEPKQLLIEACSGCHAADEQGRLSRMKTLRKTPEGWEMTLVRMDIWHGVALEPEERRTLVKYLADTQGLAPEETAPYRGLLERRPNMLETYADDEVGVICARCHSYGRIALQRRDEEEWRKLSHTHLGQWPTAEYQALGRDRDWWGIARDQMPPKLASLYPFKTEAWDKWQARKPLDPAGTWRVSGERPGSGRYTGYLKIKALGNDRFEADYQLTFADGKTVSGRNQALLYTGYEWRGAGKLGEEEVRSVYALSPDGNRLSGRWFLKGNDETGGDLTAVRVKEGESGIVAVEPPYIRAGATARLTIHGYNLMGEVKPGPGLEVKQVIDASPERVTVELRATDQAEPGKRVIAVGTTATPEPVLAVYKQIDAVRVEPAFAIARVGGGAIDPVTAQLQAVGYLNGPDGKPDTEDDIRLGSFPARWAMDNFNEAAAAMQDTQFAGTLTDTGLFVPGPGGPNPRRKFGTSNTGDLKITATVQDGERSVSGDGRLISTAQRWNTPPIR